MQNFSMYTTKILIRLHTCASWSKSLLALHQKVCFLTLWLKLLWKLIYAHWFWLLVMILVMTLKFRLKRSHTMFNPNKPNGFSHPYTLGVHLSFKGCQVYLFLFVLFEIENPVSKQWRPWSDTHYAASDLDLHCLPMAHKRDARLIWGDLGQPGKLHNF